VEGKQGKKSGLTDRSLVSALALPTSNGSVITNPPGNSAYISELVSARLKHREFRQKVYSTKTEAACKCGSLELIVKIKKRVLPSYRSGG